MWRITPEGRQLLNDLSLVVGGRAEFGGRVGVGKNQVKILLEDPDHAIKAKTRAKLVAFCEAEGAGWEEGRHYLPLRVSNRVLVRLARDRDPAKNLTERDRRGLVRLYEALLENPAFAGLRPALDPLDEFERWFDAWGGMSEGAPSEQLFAYRTFRDKVIAFLFAERHLASPGRRRARVAPTPDGTAARVPEGGPEEYRVVALWYLVGTSNAFYEDSPVGLDAEDAGELPIGERQSAASLGIRLLEELAREGNGGAGGTDRGADFLVFEVEAEGLRRPDSHARRLFRVYAQAEEDVRRHFSRDPVLRDARFFVLGFPYFVPRARPGQSRPEMVEHRLVCCPLAPELRRTFSAGRAAPAVVHGLLATLYRMYWDYLDGDSPQRAAVGMASERELSEFREAFVNGGRGVPCLSLGEYIRVGFP